MSLGAAMYVKTGEEGGILGQQHIHIILLYMSYLNPHESSKGITEREKVC
jgi:hypothetical protein